ncbi:hypothetical protein RJ640_002497 [Escallonia rubra]|uniref:beta-galactosidase n=1 Tax=Escallonia rubra TaxID=112253 RepID=A0AA88URW3_9ASTE|nr:hypothetical protein RJ640_002497 [Escallonia rubra]
MGYSCSCCWFSVWSILCFFYFWASVATQVSYDRRAVIIDGERKIIISGSIHYPRSTPEMWPSLIQKSKSGGLNTIETYVFWNAHEPQRRQYDFSGNLDLVRFLKTIQEQSLGLPVWLRNLPGTRIRTYNEVFMCKLMFFLADVSLCAIQIENEYGDIIRSYGEDGRTYINWCAQFAESLDIGVPWLMCRERDAPPPMLEGCDGWYCDQFYPKNSSTPKIWSENWTGWFNVWGGKDPHRTAEDVAFAVARFYQYGGTLHNYYMYHGGTNFGRTAGGPYIATTYDYDAPLDEYGNLNQPKWGHLRQLHLLIMSMEKILTYGDVRNVEYGHMMTATTFAYDGQRICFFGNANERNDITITFEGHKYTVPAWSVSILLDCNNEVYNTARVNSQTSIMVKRPSEAANMEWSWRKEKIEHMESQPLRGRSFYSAKQLLDQKVVTNDTSDYLWYMTSVDIDGNDPVWARVVTLQVHTGGHVVHAFVNGKHVGNVTLTFLSNSGANYETIEHGVIGPVKLLGMSNQERDLSTNTWLYRVGLDGEENRFYEDNADDNWHLENLPSHEMFVWYKTNFESPKGEDPVVLDLLSLGKGTAWVNGKNIGRYWPSYLSDEDGCPSSCDYRGAYNPNKCSTNCGRSSQRWYHVPRSFLRDEGNSLVLFEEFGGNPEFLDVQTITTGKVCAHVHEGNTLELSCQGGKPLSDISFASFGDPKGSCGSFEKGSCESPNSLSVVRNACIGKDSCSVTVVEQNFEASGCRSIKRSLAVEAVC